MKVTDFNKYYERFTQDDGKEFFETAMQFAGWWFLQLTEKQVEKVAFLMIKWGYEIKTNSNVNKRYVETKNGICLYID